jgi:hypothetical protein
LPPFKRKSAPSASGSTPVPASSSSTATSSGRASSSPTKATDDERRKRAHEYQRFHNHDLSLNVCAPCYVQKGDKTLHKRTSKANYGKEGFEGCGLSTETKKFAPLYLVRGSHHQPFAAILA